MYKYVIPKYKNYSPNILLMVYFYTILLGRTLIGLCPERRCRGLQTPSFEQRLMEGGMFRKRPGDNRMSDKQLKSPLMGREVILCDTQEG